MISYAWMVTKRTFKHVTSMLFYIFEIIYQFTSWLTRVFTGYGIHSAVAITGYVTRSSEGPISTVKLLTDIAPACDFLKFC